MSKTITITDEEYEFLKLCKKELNTQNNRSTRDPIYCIQDIHREYGKDSMYGFDGYVWIDIFCSENIYYTDEELLQDYSLMNDNDLDTDSINLRNNNDYNDIRLFEKSYYSENYVLEESGPFSFFEKDAIEHLNKNDYHYSSKARTYACGLWRSPRMEKLRNFLLTIDIK